MMRDNPISVYSNSDISVSSSSRRRMDHESHFLPSGSREFESEITSLIKDSETEGVFEYSFSEGALLCDSLGTLL